MKIQSDDISETEAFGSLLVTRKILRRGDIVALDGELGAGKTALVRGIMSALDGDAPVQSPSYALVNEYSADGEIKKVLHFDVYRITGEDDLLSTGFFDYDFENSLTLIEWYSNIQKYFTGATVSIDIAVTGETSREIKVDRL